MRVTRASAVAVMATHAMPASRSLRFILSSRRVVLCAGDPGAGGGSCIIQLGSFCQNGCYRRTSLSPPVVPAKAVAGQRHAPASGGPGPSELAYLPSDVLFGPSQQIRHPAARRML